MKEVKWIVVAVGLTFWMTGCARMTTQIVDKPRVDQDLKGNQGYLVGKAPAAAERSKTRKVLETNVEMATMDEMNPWKKSKAPAAQPSAQPQSKRVPATSAPVKTALPMEEEEEELSVAPARSSRPASEKIQATAASTSYTVKAGDTLEKIASKIYGDSSEWRRIYQANREKLSNPSRIYPGQKLIIPAWERAQSSRRADSGSSELK